MGFYSGCSQQWISIVCPLTWQCVCSSPCPCRLIWTLHNHQRRDSDSVYCICRLFHAGHCVYPLLNDLDRYISLWRYVVLHLSTTTEHLEFRYAITSVPQLVTDALQEIVSVQRISAFLQRPDVQYLEDTEGTSIVAAEDEPLVVVGDIAWTQPQEDTTQDSTPFVLQDLNLNFQRGTVTLITGKFGSGKSLLLNALLGEVALLQGRISYAVSSVANPWQTETAIDWGQCLEGLAYVPQVSRADTSDGIMADHQTAWLQSMSIRQVSNGYGKAS